MCYITALQFANDPGRKTPGFTYQYVREKCYNQRSISDCSQRKGMPCHTISVSKRDSFGSEQKGVPARVASISVGSASDDKGRFWYVQQRSLKRSELSKSAFSIDPLDDRRRVAKIVGNCLFSCCRDANICDPWHDALCKTERSPDAMPYVSRATGQVVLRHTKHAMKQCSWSPTHPGHPSLVYCDSEWLRLVYHRPP
jgi:hypothetical protein